MVRNSLYFAELDASLASLNEIQECAGRRPSTSRRSVLEVLPMVIETISGGGPSRSRSVTKTKIADSVGFHPLHGGQPQGKRWR